MEVIEEALADGPYHCGWTGCWAPSSVGLGLPVVDAVFTRVLLFVVGGSYHNRSI